MREGGLESKYEVLRHGQPIADCFVLRYDRDPHALVALAAYAASVRAENEVLSDDLWRMVKVFRPRPLADVDDEKYGDWRDRQSGTGGNYGE